jgi:Arc/MetJ-type ribon-helix-helix transcriptional regulator
VNVPESYIDAIERLVGGNGLYPSRSELIRCAVREFLLKELKMAKNMTKYDETEIDDFDSEKFVKIPIENKDKEEPVRQFKTYKILRRLENSVNSTESGNLSEEENEDDEYTEEEIEKYYKSGNKRAKELEKPSLTDLRKKFPNQVSFKFINESWT